MNMKSDIQSSMAGLLKCAALALYVEKPPVPIVDIAWLTASSAFMPQAKKARNAAPVRTT